MSAEQEEWLRTLTRNVTRSEANWWMTFILSLFLGCFGADRFYLNSPILGVLKLVTAGGFAVWWLVDLILLCFNRIHDDTGAVVMRPF
jgi:hypothetical protein